MSENQQPKTIQGWTYIRVRILDDEGYGRDAEMRIYPITEYTRFVCMVGCDRDETIDSDLFSPAELDQIKRYIDDHHGQAKQWLKEMTI